MTYRVGFQHSSLFAGLLVENSDPFRDTGETGASLMASASWKINIAHLAHLSDSVYPITGVRANVNTLKANGFPVTLIEKAGTEYDPDNGASGTSYDLIHFLLPFVDAGWESPRIVLSPANFTNPQLSFTLTGADGAKCVVQAATSVSSPSWTSLVTNLAPFTFVETNTSLFPQRFYRALVAP
jgi:hypothetical protein